MKGKEAPVQSSAFLLKKSCFNITAGISQFFHTLSRHLAVCINRSDNNPGILFSIMKSAQGGVFP